MNPELKKEILDIIYNADWYFDAPDEVDDYSMNDEDEVVEKLIQLIMLRKFSEARK